MVSATDSKENCVGDYYGVYRFTYTYMQPIGRSVWGTGEVETIGHQLATAYFDVLAVSPALAKAAYDKQFGLHLANHDEHTLISGPELLCYVDSMVRVGSL